MIIIIIQICVVHIQGSYAPCNIHVYIPWRKLKMVSKFNPISTNSHSVFFKFLSRRSFVKSTRL